MSSLKNLILPSTANNAIIVKAKFETQSVKNKNIIEAQCFQEENHGTRSTHEHSTMACGVITLLKFNQVTSVYMFAQYYAAPPGSYGSVELCQCPQ